MTKWSDKRKKAINCDAPKGFSEKADCASKKMAGGGLAKPHSLSRTGANKIGQLKVVKNLLTLVNDTFQKLRLKVLALVSTLRRPKPSEPEKPPVNNS